MKTSPIWTLALLLLFAACDKTDPPGQPDPIDFSRGIFVLNEGNFNWGNASLDFIDAEGELHEKVFQGANDAPLGDVGQSIEAFGGDLFVVVNNSGKVERLNGADLKVRRTLTGFTSPRSMELLSSEKAYVTDLYADAISVVHPQTGASLGEIAVGGWTEDLLAVGGKTFVAQMGTDQVLVVDNGTDALVDSFYVGREPNSMVVDAQGFVWALCSGGLQEERARLVRFDAGTYAVERAFDFPDSLSSPGNLAIDPSGQELYFLNGDVYAMAVSATALPAQPLIAAGDRVLYHLEVDGRTGNVFVTDAVDYVQRGHLLEYNAGGDLLRQWNTGIIPGDLLFLP